MSTTNMMREMVLPDVECAIVHLIQSSSEGKAKGLTLRELGKDSTIQNLCQPEYLSHCLDDLIDKHIVEAKTRRFKVTEQFQKAQVLLIPSSLNPTKSMPEGQTIKSLQQEMVPLEVDSDKKAPLTLADHIRLFGANHNIQFFDTTK